MGFKPQLNLFCSRCKTAHGPFAPCVSTRKGKSRVRPKVAFGNCPVCKKAYGAGGPLTHKCSAKSDFRRRKKKADAEQEKRDRQQRQANQPGRPKHPDPRECRDDSCTRRACALWKEALALGEQRGREKAEERAADQLQDMYRMAYARGRAECPREHK